MVPTLVENSYFLVYFFVNGFFFGNIVIMKYNTGVDPEDFKGFHALFASDRSISSLYKLLFKKSFLGKLKSVYYHTITYHKSL